MADLLDLSHAVEHGMTTYPGLPGPSVSTHLSFEDSSERYAPGTEFSIARIDMVGNTGTYLDTPAHRFRDGHDLAGLPLAAVADLPGVVVDAPASGPAPASVLDHVALAGRAVLVRTGWDRHWRTDRYGDPSHPYLGDDLVDAIVAGGAALVGIDSVNVDGTATGERPVHTALLGAGIPVLEHLTRLGTLGPSGTTGFRLFAVPPKVVGVATFPVRAFAVR